jgi:hypothetical protein
MVRFHIAGGGKAARFVAMLLYGVRPRAPITLVAATVVLMVVGAWPG